MIKIFFLLIALFSKPIFSQEKVAAKFMEIQGSKKFPLELNLLINSLHIQPESISDQAIIKSIMKIDDYAQVLSKEDIFIIGKIEVYKTLLKNYNIKNSKIKFDNTVLSFLKIMILKSKDPFTKWFLRALQHDSELILNNPLYRDYQRLLVSGGELKNIEIKRIHKKAQLINRWLSKIDANSPEDFQTELRPSLIEALLNIEQSYFLLAKSIRFESLPAAINKASDLRFFELKEVSKPSASPVIVKKAKTVEDILNPIIGDEPPVKVIPKPKLPTPSKENWLEDEEAPESLKNLPKATNDASWLEDF